MDPSPQAQRQCPGLDILDPAAAADRGGAIARRRPRTNVRRKATRQRVKAAAVVGGLFLALNVYAVSFPTAAW
jgi:hypothetical protein